MSQNKSQSKTSRIGSLPASFPASSTTATSASTCSQRTEGNKENQMVKSDVAAVSSQLANKTNSARLLMERQKSDIGVSNAACGSRSTSSRPSGSLYSSSSFDASTLTQQLQKQQQAKKEQPLSSTSTITADVDELSQVKRRKFLDEQMASTFPDKTPTTLSPPPAAQQQQQQQAAATTSNNVVVKSDEIHSSWFDDTDSVSSSAGSRLGSSSIGSSQSSTMSVYDAGACTFYGLPEKCRELLKQLRNISCLYEWQHKLLSDMHERYERAVRERRRQLTNLLYMSPTSGGKTLVAELLMLHCLLMRRKSVVFVMPFVSIVQEKVALMQPFGEQLHFHVEEYAGVKGMLPPLKRNQPAKTTLYICTIEKAHSLVNSLIETGRLAGEIGMLVADELHMIGDGSRGAIYEMILSKVKYCSKAASSAYDSTATANTSSSSSSAIGYFILLEIPKKVFVFANTLLLDVTLWCAVRRRPPHIKCAFRLWRRRPRWRTRARWRASSTRSSSRAPFGPSSSTSTSRSSVKCCSSSAS